LEAGARAPRSIRPNAALVRPLHEQQVRHPIGLVARPTDLSAKGEALLGRLLPLSPGEARKGSRDVVEHHELAVDVPLDHSEAMLLLRALRHPALELQANLGHPPQRNLIRQHHGGGT